MKKSIIVILLMTLFLIPGISLAEDEEEVTVLGKILEMVSNKGIIQVGDRNYRVEKVVIDDGSEKEPILGGILDLKVGSLVRVYVGEKDEGFWKAKKVVLFVGAKREEVQRDFD
jgi:hypothetical protein